MPPQGQSTQPHLGKSPAGAKLSDCAISRKPILPKLPGNFHEVAPEAVTVKELAARIGTGGYKPQLSRRKMAFTRLRKKPSGL